MCNSTTVARNIKFLAKGKKLSLKMLFEECGMGRNAMSHMTNGSMPRGDTLAKIADYLDCSVDYLLGRTNDNNSNNSNGNITNSTVVQGINHSSVVMKNSSELTSTDEEIELLRIFKMLDVKQRHRLLDLAFSFEEEINNK